MFNQIDNTVIIWTDTTLSVLVLEQTDWNFLFVQTSTIKYTMTRKRDVKNNVMQMKIN